MELKNLQTFLRIADTGSFTKAAEALGYTQSTISFQIKQLEEELGVPVFDRIGRHVQLTDDGKRLLAHAMRLSNDLQDLYEDFGDASMLRGTVRMFGAGSIVEKMMLLNYDTFYRTYPGVKLVFSTGDTIDLLKTLDRNEADVIFTLDSHISQPQYVIARESPVRLHFVAAASHPLAARTALTIHDLLAYPLLLTEHGMSYRKILDHQLSIRSLQVEPVLETGRTDIIVRCLKNGIGIGFLPDFITEPDVRDGSLRLLEVDGFDLTIWKQLIYHRDKWISRPLAAFLEFVKEKEFLW